MTIDYGSDITFTGEDINPNLSLTYDSSVVLEALSFRLQSDYGSLWYDPDYGFNINALIKSPINMKNGITKLQSRIEAECRKDTRVKKATVVITDFSISTSGQSMKITISILLQNGEQDELVFNLNDSDLDITTKNI